MKEKFLIIILFLSLLLSGCSPNNKEVVSQEESYDTSFDISSIENDVATRILSDFYVDASVESVYIHSNKEEHYCDIIISWSGLNLAFKEQCYFILPGIKEVLESYEYEYTQIVIYSAYFNDSSKLCTLHYINDDDITLTDSTGEKSSYERLTYDQLNVLNVEI